MACEEVNILYIEIVWHTVYRRTEIFKSARGSLAYPFIAVTVAVEYNALVLFYNAAYELVQAGFKIIGIFENIGIFTQRLCHGGVEHHVCAGD